ncbi:MAG: helix-turn-helix domain-containing protein [Betaproteobacteria bacterium]|nr:helix-turn-helix domain-containing protein [Betaproteobacteria bacterium]
MIAAPLTPEALRAQIAGEVRRQRLARHLTQNALGQMTGLTRQTVIAIESGQPVSGQSLLAVMAALGLRAASTLPPAEKEPAPPTLKALMRAQRLRG